ncbi:hypothetical protein FOZ63_031963 [Perkinsus olseni]|uniref:Peptidase A1 domain-containing protein n=1 Tax=Perkinsus olseni TaxID=32597 RepID=A0A7J6SJS3_PEROL|nr:hypothetical protein FOZ63_031963 [Perkinsus olseni]
MTLGLRRIQCFILSVVCGSIVNAQLPEEDEDDYIPLLDQLVMKRVIKSTDFSIVFNPGNLSEGELILGGLDPSRYRGPMSFVPLKDGYNTWTVGLKSIHVVGNAIPVPLNRNMPISIDGGTTGLYLPRKVFDSLVTTINSFLKPTGRRVDLKGSSRDIPALRDCGDREYLPSLHLALTSSDGRDLIVSVPQELYVEVYNTLAGPLCVLAFRVRMDDVQEIAIGLTLLRKYNVYFQYDQRRVGFAETKPKNKAEPPSKGHTALRPE